MRRKIITLLAGLVLAAAPAAAAMAAPAHEYCESSGNHYCMKNINNSGTDGNPIVEGSFFVGDATSITWVATGAVFEGLPVGNLRINAHPGDCVALGSVIRSQIELHGCAAYGTAWAEGTRNNALVFLSRPATQALGSDQWLSGDGCLNCQLTLNGVYQRWDGRTTSAPRK